MTLAEQQLTEQHPFFCLEAVLAPEENELGLQGLVSEAEFLFKEKYGENPGAYAAGSSRVEFFGNFTDQGYGLHALGFPTQLRTVSACRKRDDRTIRIFSSLRPDENPIEFDLDSPQLAENMNHWTKYQRSIIQQLQQKEGLDFGKLQGADIILTSNIPPGSGISSSAAVEAAFTHGFLNINGVEMSNKEIALLTKKAENEAGAGCGYLDQGTSNAQLEPGCAALLHFTDDEEIPYTTESVYADLEQHGVTLVLAYDPTYERELGAIDYDAKARGIKEGMDFLAQMVEEQNIPVPVPELNLMNSAIYDQLKKAKGEEIAKLALHAIADNQRTLEAAELFRQLGQLQANQQIKADAILGQIGQLMNKSAQSSLDNYGVDKGKERDVITLRPLLETMRAKGAIGARNMGGGGNPTSIMLVKTEEADAIIAQVQAAMKESYPTSDFHFEKVQLGKPSRVLKLQS